MRANILSVCALGLVFGLTGCISMPPNKINVELCRRIGRKPTLEEINGTYVLEPPDSISIEVSDNADLTRTCVIRPDGNITFPMLGDIYIEGLTPLQVREFMTKLLSRFLKNPELTVTLAGYNSKRIIIWRESLGAQVLPFTGDMTVLDAVAQAGGIHVEEAPRRVRVIRAGISGESGSISLKDVLNWKKFCAKLMRDGEGGSNRPVIRIWTSMPPQTREAVRKGAAGEELTIEQKRDMVEQINRLLSDPDLYWQADVDALVLSDETQRLVDNFGEDSGAKEARVLNCALLHATFRDELAASYHEPEGLKLDLLEIAVKGNHDENIMLRNGDVVFIPTNVFHKIGNVVSLLLTPVRAPLQMASTASAYSYYGSQGVTYNQNQSGGYGRGYSGY